MACKITLNSADKDQGDLLLWIVDFNKNTKLRNLTKNTTTKETFFDPISSKILIS